MTAIVGLSLLAGRLLGVIRDYPQVTIGTACRRMDMDKAWRSRVANAAVELETAGLIRRGHGENGARPMTITTAGLAVLDGTTAGSASGSGGVL